MSTLDRYIQNLFLKNLAITLLGLISLYGIVEFIEKADEFIEHQAALRYYLLFPFYNLPLMISNSLPMAVLLSSFATIGGLSRTNQLTALLGSGLSITRISRPIFIIGALLSGLIMICNLWLTPLGIRETEYIRNVEVKKKNPGVTNESNDLYFKSNNRIIHIQRSFPQRETLLGITVISFNDAFKPTTRLQATSGTYQNDGIWSLKEVKVWQFSPEDKTISHYMEKSDWPLDLMKKPEDLSQIWNTPEEMTQTELTKVIQSLQADGYDTLNFKLESHLRFSRAFIPIIMVLLGLPFALQKGRKASFALGIIISLIIFIIYFVLYATFAALGGASILSPVVAAWAANVLMALIGSWMFLQAQD